MSELFSQLGVNPIALFWQMANFAVVLVVLFYFVYRPLTELVAKRTKKIEEGLADAVRAKEELAQAETVYAEKLGQAEGEAFELVRRAETEASSRAKEIVQKGEERGAGIVAEARTLAESARAEEMRGLEQEAKAFVAAVLTKTVQLDPALVDAKLVEQAAEAVRAERHHKV
jgi:F-type H+-transporting ATPase subunit b